MAGKRTSNPTPSQKKPGFSKRQSQALYLSNKSISEKDVEQDVKQSKFKRNKQLRGGAASKVKNSQEIQMFQVNFSEKRAATAKHRPNKSPGSNIGRLSKDNLAKLETIQVQDEIGSNFRTQQEPKRLLDQAKAGRPGHNSPPQKLTLDKSGSPQRDKKPRGKTAKKQGADGENHLALGFKDILQNSHNFKREQNFVDSSRFTGPNEQELLDMPDDQKARLV